MVVCGIALMFIIFGACFTSGANLVMYARRESEMSAAISAGIGLFMGISGFLVMRNPYRLSITDPWHRGYYQRLVVDAMQRNQLRVLGAVICIFGSSICADALASLLKWRTFETIADALWVLMVIVFTGAFVTGIVIAIVLSVRGELFEWFTMWKAGEQLGEVNVCPAMTPTMEKEARLFTIALCGMAAVAVVAAVLR